MKSVHIYVTKFTQELPESLWNDYVSLLPYDQKERNLRYKRWQDKHSHLFGRLLLLNGLKRLDQIEESLQNLQYNEYDRPIFADDIDFNISHSEEYVICAIRKGLKLGIDIEKIKEVKFEDFKTVMTDEQWKDIYQSSNPSQSFFKYWTIKESVIKADGRGLSIPLLDIHVKNNLVEYDNQIWYLNDLLIDKDYCACLATNIADVNITLKFNNFYRNY